MFFPSCIGLRVRFSESKSPTSNKSVELAGTKIYQLILTVDIFLNVLINSINVIK